ncbi:MATE family efflux transporter, partial [Lysinibacillus fusiformis]|uniref:MATE family efflux transporter n=1 Tax=Lysinibacillus fusiformis TaxID=28031 RepID=UPI00201C18E8
SGVGAVSQYIHIAILILEVVGNGASIVVSQYLGSRRFFEAAKISALAVTMNLVVGLLMSILFFFFAKHLLTMMNLQVAVLH